MRLRIRMNNGAEKVPLPGKRRKRVNLGMRMGIKVRMSMGKDYVK